ncbi:MAG: hypothetical protein AAFX40_05665 [Cyanobacteria bacterium J06639_1]
MNADITNTYTIAAEQLGYSHFPFAATALLAIGFIVAVGFGSVAWFNSKRPAGWEGSERPDIVPEVDA